MTDLKDDLAALRLEREPERPARRWVVWIAVLVIAAVAVVAAWRWVTRAQPLEVQTATVAERAAGLPASSWK